MKSHVIDGVDEGVHTAVAHGQPVEPQPQHVDVVVAAVVEKQP